MRPSPSLLLVTVALCVAALSPVCALEATFTPNPDDAPAGGPLPQSQKYRDQLTTLYEAITTSPDPNGALQAAAQSNNMAPEELAQILQRHAADMGLATAPVTAARRVVNFVLGMFGKLLAAAKAWARGNPAAASAAMAALLLAASVLYKIPQTGVVVPLGMGAVSTFWGPPRTFVEDLLRDLVGDEGGGWTTRMGDSVWDLPRVTLEDVDGEKARPDGWITFEPCGRKKKRGKSRGKVDGDAGGAGTDGLVMCATARIEIPLPDLLEEGGGGGDAGERRARDALAAEMAFDAVSSVLGARRFGEYLPPGSPFYRFQHADDGDGREVAALVLRGRGRCGSYAVQPLVRSYEEREEREGARRTVASAFSTVASGRKFAGHFEGEIRFSVELEGGYVDGETAAQEEEEAIASEENDVVTTVPRITCSVTFAAPSTCRRSHRLPERFVRPLLRDLAGSFARSSSTSARAAAARRRQSGSHRAALAESSARVRKKRHVYMAEMEAMARDRRRKWRRAGGGGERWRPSGQRQRSPLNC